MVTNRDPGPYDYSTRHYEMSGRFRPWWSIPRVDTEEKPETTKRKRQINNLALLFIIYVFKKAKKAWSAKKMKKSQKAKS